jgi:two-component system, OmpR family, sensor histidine kinase BaeS
MHTWPRARPRRLFFRLAMSFGFGAALLMGSVILAGYLAAQWFGGDNPRTAVLLWTLGCSIVVFLPLVAGVLWRRAYQSIAAPLAGVMNAADAVADGDLSVRLAGQRRGDMGRLEDSFNTMVAELQRADRLRRSLTADVAHELRTPIHILQGNLEGILDGVYPADEDQINNLLEETHRLSRLVEDLQTLSLAESGHLPLQIETLDAAALLADIETSFSALAETNEINLQVNVSGAPAELSFAGDSGRLYQALSNLAANALRHTPEGGSVIVAAAADPNGVRFTVSDSGPGIPPEDLENIFKRFWRGDSTRSRSLHHSGSDLGLAITRQLVQLHGGTIAAANRPEGGAVFTIRLPAPPL